MKVGLFTDNDFSKTNGVTTTLRAVLGHLPADVGARVYTADDLGADEPDYLALRAPGIGIPFYREMRLHWPRFGAFLARARADGLDVIHYTTPGPVGLAARYVAGKLGLPMTGSFHTLLSEYTEVLSGSRRLGQAMRIYQRWAYGRCATVLAPSDATARLLVDAGFGRDRLRVWARGVDTGVFTPARRSEAQRAAWGARPQVPIVAYVGRLSREKGLDALPAISRSLLAIGQPHRLLFVGDGPMRAELEAACPGAIFTGKVRHDHVPALLASADLFWFPSRTDTFGNVVLEAQACGLPVIVTDEGGPREAVRHGETGLVCGASGPFTLALALSWLLREPARRAQMGAAARRYALTRSWPLALEPLFDAWREVHRAGVAAPPLARMPVATVPLAPVGAGPAR
jgi:glycosyltransferase involved in cell wall biosynthesis